MAKTKPMPLKLLGTNFQFIYPGTRSNFLASNTMGCQTKDLTPVFYLILTTVSNLTLVRLALSPKNAFYFSISTNKDTKTE
jgi:hypothetical protein